MTGNAMDTVKQLQVASRAIPRVWDGRQSILEMKNAGFRHWRQMEWMGFYFEFQCVRHFGDILRIPGPRHGKVEFDALGRIPWDFKAHAANTTRSVVIANDAEAISAMLDTHGQYGIILAIGDVEYNDDERTFKQWHDALKGGRSDYERKRIARGAISRQRKTSFSLMELHFICLDEDHLAVCSASFQEGFRNADGSPRNAKVMLRVRDIPDEALLASEYF